MHQLYNPETCRTYYQHRMKCTDLSSTFVLLQQGIVLIVSIKCVGVKIDCTSLKPSVHNTNIMHHIMAYFVRLYITQCSLYGCVNQRSDLYINCTTMILVVHITNTV